MAEQDGLGETLRAWRDRLPPSATGLPSGRARRTSGLRREELAQLAGLSVDYVVRLEQGRATTPSAQVVASLARSLQLTTAERDHLYRLAGLAPPGDGTMPEHIPPGMHRVLTRLGDAAVAVFAADWRMVWWNRGWAALFGDPSTVPVERRNFALHRFPLDGDLGARVAHWPVTSLDDDGTDLAVVSDLRRATGRFPHDARLAALVRTLRAGNPRFARMWATGTVAAHREDSKTVVHPAVGPIAVDCDVLSDGDTELKVVVLTAVPGSADETALQLAVVAGTSPAAPEPVGRATAAS